MSSTYTIAENIKRLLSMFPKLESYNELVYAYWILFDGVSSIKDAKRATPAESITRVFRLLVEAGEIETPIWVKKSKEVKPIHEFSALA